VKASLHGAARQAKPLPKLCDRRIRVGTSCLSNASKLPAHIKGSGIVQPLNRLSLPHARPNGSLQIGSFCVDTSVQLTSHLAQHTARLHLCNRTPCTESSQEIKDLDTALPHDHSSSASSAQAPWETHVRKSLQEQLRLIGCDHHLQMDSPGGKGERTSGQEPPAQKGEPTVLRSTWHSHQCGTA